MSYIVEQGPGNRPLIVVTYKKEIKKYYPEEILALFLNQVKEHIEAYLLVPVRDIVVTVPSYFNKLQIWHTVMGCERAGFRVLRTIKEP